MTDDVNDRATTEEVITICVVWAQSPVSDLVRTPAPRVEATATVSEAVATMDATGVSFLLVGGDAVITEHELAQALGRGVSRGDAVATVATGRAVVVEAATTVADACSVMLDAGVHHLLVRDAESAWVLSLREVVAVLLEAAEPALWLASLHDASSPFAPASELWIG